MQNISLTFSLLEDDRPCSLTIDFWILADFVELYYLIFYSEIVGLSQVVKHIHNFFILPNHKLSHFDTAHCKLRLEMLDSLETSAINVWLGTDLRHDTLE